MPEGWGRAGRRRAWRRLWARGLVVVIAAAGAVVTTAAPTFATSISEFSTGISFPAGQITYGADGNVWFTEPAGNRIGKITPAGAVTEYTAGITAGAGLGGIALGPDGNVWFTEATAGNIGTITPAGTVTEYPAAAGGSPMGITAGSDGNLWFTEPKVGSGSDAIGRMTTTGTLLTITAGVTNGTTPMAITSGSDGNVWFTEQSGGRIGRVAIPADTITEFAAGLAPLSLEAITSGSDGNLWVAEPSTDHVARVTTAGVATQLSSGITASSRPTSIAPGPDGSLWFTEASGNRIARITPAGTVTEYSSGITAASSPQGIVMGSDNNLWFTESGGARIGRIYQPGLRGIDVSNHQGTINWSQVASAGYSFGYAKATEGDTFVDATFPTNWAGMKSVGMARGAYMFFRSNVDPVAETNLFLSALNAAGFTPQDLGPVVDVETTDGQSAATILANLRTAVDQIKSSIGVWPVIYTSPNFWMSVLGNPTTFNTDPLWIANWGVRSPIVPASNWGGSGWSAWQYSSTGSVLGISTPVDLDQASWTGLPLMGPRGTQAAVSTAQYTLQNSDGVTWKEIDPLNLRLYESPTISQSVLLTANADLFTAIAGHNQDLGIFVSDNGGADQLLAWKESGGFAGTYSPNAAFVQDLFAMTSGHSYVFKLEWKTNGNAPGTTIFAGAGSAPKFSPTSLMAQIFTAAPTFKLSTTQYRLAGSDGVTWQPIDALHLSATVMPVAGSTAMLGANVDLWTANAGFNQDIGIFASDNGGADTLVAWKESGGSAGTFSPNAAYVKATYPMVASHSYVFTLKWKTNHNAPSATIYAAAGGAAPYSPTSLFVESIAAGANPYATISTGQYSLGSSDGVTWRPMDTALDVTVTPGVTENSIIGANTDLWTANAGYNQDIGIFVTDNGGADTLLAWKESGGLAGTYSPNAAFAQAMYPMIGGHTYVFKLKWKTNQNASGARIYAGAGSGPVFSPTRMVVEVAT